MIDWHVEALDFCKRNNICPTDYTIGTTEKAMQVGAVLMIGDIHERIIKPADKQLTKERLDSLPHTNIIRIVAI